MAERAEQIRAGGCKYPNYPDICPFQVKMDDDGVRETYWYVKLFPATFSRNIYYVALAQYHIPSVIKPHIRYNGSIPLVAKLISKSWSILISRKKKPLATLKFLFQNYFALQAIRKNETKESLKAENQSVWVNCLQAMKIFDFLTWIEEQAWVAN